MSRESATALLDRLTGDTSFRDQVLAAASNEQRRRLVAEAGYDIGPDDLLVCEEMVGFEELSNEDLERVAGGDIGTGPGLAIAVGAVALVALAI